MHAILLALCAASAFARICFWSELITCRLGFEVVYISVLSGIVVERDLGKEMWEKRFGKRDLGTKVVKQKKR